MSDRPTPHPSGAWSSSDYAKAYDDLERQLAEAMAQLRIADEQLALERGALAEAREQRDALAKECEWMRALIETIRDKADLRFNGNRGLCAFSDLKDAALAAVKETPNNPAQPPQVG